MISTSVIQHLLKTTLSGIATDNTDGMESGMVLKDWMEEDTQDDQWVDVQEVGGPGYASEKSEGGEMALGEIKEGATYRYLSRTFALKMIITREAIEDNKYPRGIQAAKRLKRTIYKTADSDATLMLERGWNSSYVFGDGVSLFNASHPLPNGGTFSNLLATPASPSQATLIAIQAQLGRMPSNDGTPEGYKITKAIFPPEQWGIWSALLGSQMNPVLGNFSEVNVIKRDLDIKPVQNKYWAASTTNYALRTDCEDGPTFKWRVKPMGNSWVDEDQGLVKFGIRARWSRGHHNPRGIFGVQA